MIRKYGIKIIILFFVAQLGYGQTPLKSLSLDKAYELLENRYPSLKDSRVLKEIHEKEQSKLNRNRLPEIYLKAEAKGQSETPSIDLAPGTALPFEIDLPLYSAKILLSMASPIIGQAVCSIMEESVFSVFAGSADSICSKESTSNIRSCGYILPLTVRYLYP